METIDLDKLNAMLDAQITANVEDIKHAVKNEWYDKAAALNKQNEGIMKAKFIANSGDCHK
ncbi:hypothetical protein [uncultured Shewanella sp.]|uniref:hypothetical protein n=1 Tax=uncultured Shewanella sp. TaxID=173975 RepID=UPI00261206D3|nr:hypothetical protein [uncultured Shewanella sp.]